MNNFQLKSLNAIARSNQERVRLMRKMNFPVISLGVDYSVIGKGLYTGVDAGKDAIMPMISLNIPIYSKSNKATVNNALLGYEFSKVKVDDYLLGMKQKHILLHQEYEENKRKLVLYESLSDKTLQAENLALKANETGDQDLFLLLDLKKQQVVYEIKSLEAKVALLKNSSKMNLLMPKM